MFSTFSFRDLQEWSLLGESINENEYDLRILWHIQIFAQVVSEQRQVHPQDKRPGQGGDYDGFPTQPKLAWWESIHTFIFCVVFIFYLILFHFGTFFRFN